MAGENKKVPNMELPTVNRLLTETGDDRLEVTTWHGQGVKANNLDGDVCPQPEAIDPLSLTPDVAVMTLNPGSVTATLEFRAYKEGKARGVTNNQPTS